MCVCAAGHDLFHICLLARVESLLSPAECLLETVGQLIVKQWKQQIFGCRPGAFVGTQNRKRGFFIALENSFVYILWSRAHQFHASQTIFLQLNDILFWQAQEKFQGPEEKSSCLD